MKWPHCEGGWTPAVDLEYEDVDGYRLVRSGKCPSCGWHGRLTKSRDIWGHRQRSADEPSAGKPLTHITIVPWDADSDMAIVYHDGELVWQDSLSSIDQYLRHTAPHGVPVILEVRDA